MKKGAIYTVAVEDVTFGSDGLARVDGKVVFVPGALPGEEVEIQIRRKRKDYAEAKLLDVKKYSEHRVHSPCSHFPICGGCKWLDVDYEYQLKLKHRIVSEVVRRIGGFNEVAILDTLPSVDIYFYRNKMEFSFSAHRWILPDEEDPVIKPKTFALGLHVPGRYDKVLDIDRCLLQSETSNQILNAVRDFALNSDLPPWNFHDHSGFWRFLVIREGKNTNEMMVNIVTSEHEAETLSRLAEQLAASFPKITSVVNNITQSRGGSAFGEREFLLAGQQVIHEKLCGYLYEISANSFFQTNTRQAERLYSCVLEFADLKGDEVVYDLYSGTGTISLYLSSYARTVVGIEVIEDAVKNARNTAKRLGVENCHFVLGDVREAFKDTASLIAAYGRPQVLIVDPPRAGIHPKSVNGILKLQPNKIVYVSCNPATFARDAKLFCEQDYELARVQPVDMFPHTHHIEVVAEFNQVKQGEA